MISEAEYIPHCALGAVPKPGGKIRPITDCSRPHNDSVNNYYGSLFREFNFKSVDNVVAVLDKGDFMTVIDIKAAYRAVPLQSDHRKYMGLRWILDGIEKTFVDNKMCFGLRLGPCYFAELSEFVYDTLYNVYGMRIINYLDDFTAVATSREECLQCQSYVIELLRYLGFHVSFEKVTPPSTCTTYLGIEIDSVAMEVRLPSGKLAKLKALLANYLAKDKISKHDLESLGGLLSHCSHVVRGGKIFCKRIYSLYKELFRRNRKSIRIPADARADIRWWRSFCESFNRVAKINNVLFDYPMVSDSSFKGFAVYLNEDWVAGMWDPMEEWELGSACGHIKVGTPAEIGSSKRDINVYELWPIVMGIKRWAKLFEISLF